MRDVNADIAKMAQFIDQASVAADILVEDVLSKYPQLVSEEAKALLTEALVQAVKSTASKLYVQARTGAKV